MSDPITWYILGKAVDDPTTIEEQIAADILIHNTDPSAHGQSSESLYEHRVQPLLDHLNYSIYNIKTAPAVRPYTAIVDLGGDGDFRDIQDAIDFAVLHGGGRVLVKPGTYTLTDDLLMYSNIQLIGEDDDTTILDFNNAAHQLEIVGSSGNLKRNILVTGFKFTNRAGTSGAALYMDYVEDIIIRRNYFNDNKPSSGAGTYDIYLGRGSYGTKRVTIELNRGYDSNRFLYLHYCKQLNFLYNYIDTYDSYGIYIVSFIGNMNGNYFNAIGNDVILVEDVISNSQILSNYVLNAEADGFHLEAAEESIIANNVLDAVKAGSLDGIRLDGAVNNIITGNVIRTFGSDGISLAASDANVMNGNYIYDCGAYGIDISGGTCDDNVVVGNIFQGNDTGGLHDAGTGTEAAHNKTI